MKKWFLLLFATHGLLCVEFFSFLPGVRSGKTYKRQYLLRHYPELQDSKSLLQDNNFTSSPNHEVKLTEIDKFKLLQKIVEKDVFGYEKWVSYTIDEGKCINEHLIEKNSERPINNSQRDSGVDGGLTRPELFVPCSEYTFNREKYIVEQANIAQMVSVAGAIASGLLIKSAYRNMGLLGLTICLGIISWQGLVKASMKKFPTQWKVTANKETLTLDFEFPWHCKEQNEIITRSNQKAIYDCNELGLCSLEDNIDAEIQKTYKETFNTKKSLSYIPRTHS